MTLQLIEKVIQLFRSTERQYDNYDLIPEIDQSIEQCEKFIDELYVNYCKSKENNSPEIDYQFLIIQLVSLNLLKIYKYLSITKYISRDDYEISLKTNFNKLISKSTEKISQDINELNTFARDKFRDYDDKFEEIYRDLRADQGLDYLKQELDSYKYAVEEKFSTNLDEIQSINSTLKVLIDKSNLHNEANESIKSLIDRLNQMHNELITELRNKIHSNEKRVNDFENKVGTCSEKVSSLERELNKYHNENNLKFKAVYNQLNTITTIFIDFAENFLTKDALDKLVKKIKINIIDKFSPEPRKESLFEECDSANNESNLISKDELQIIKSYEEKPELIFEKSTDIDISNDSRQKLRLGISVSLSLEISPGGNYQVIKKNKKFYCVPKKNLIVSEYNISEVSMLFECHNYAGQLSQNFKLLKPALLRRYNSTWELISIGKIEFFS